MPILQISGIVFIRMMVVKPGMHLQIRHMVIAAALNIFQRPIYFVAVQQVSIIHMMVAATGDWLPKKGFMLYALRSSVQRFISRGIMEGLRRSCGNELINTEVTEEQCFTEN